MTFAVHTCLVLNVKALGTTPSIEKEVEVPRWPLIRTVIYSGEKGRLAVYKFPCREPRGQHLQQPATSVAPSGHFRRAINIRLMGGASSVLGLREGPALQEAAEQTDVWPSPESLPQFPEPELAPSARRSDGK